jgi:hypothetical protein
MTCYHLLVKILSRLAVFLSLASLVKSIPSNSSTFSASHSFVGVDERNNLVIQAPLGGGVVFSNFTAFADVKQQLASSLVRLSIAEKILSDAQMELAETTANLSREISDLENSMESLLRTTLMPARNDSDTTSVPSGNTMTTTTTTTTSTSTIGIGTTTITAMTTTTPRLG